MSNSLQHLMAGNPSNQRANAWPIGVVIVGCLFMVSVAPAGVTVSPTGFADDFDTGNTVGATPAQWQARAVPGITARVVDASVTEPASPPYCVELRDENPKDRVELRRDFATLKSGKVSATFKMQSLNTASAGLQLRTTNGVHLGSVAFLSQGVMRFEQRGGIVMSKAAWTPGRWQEVEIEWFSNLTFSASLDGKPFAQQAQFVTNGVPSRIEIVVGYSEATNKIGYVDDVKVVGTQSP